MLHTDNPIHVTASSYVLPLPALPPPHHTRINSTNITSTHMLRATYKEIRGGVEPHKYNKFLSVSNDTIPIFRH